MLHGLITPHIAAAIATHLLAIAATKLLAVTATHLTVAHRLAVAATGAAHLLAVASAHLAGLLIPATRAATGLRRHLWGLLHLRRHLWRSGGMWFVASYFPRFVKYWRALIYRECFRIIGTPVKGRRLLH